MARLVIACVVTVAVAIFGFISSTVFAAGTNKGLAISPVRQELTASKDNPASGSFIVGNFTGSDKTVNLSNESFSVANYSYNYAFQKSENNWVKIRGDSEIQLKAGEEKKISYDVTLPPSATPGGHYYALLASIGVPGGGVSSTLRVASLLYLTVEGDITKSSVIENGIVSKFIIGPTINYSFDANDTGNTHFNATSFARLKGMLSQKSVEGASYLLMPEAIRTIRGSVQSPVLPGYYAITYGYRDATGKELTKNDHIIYIPIWFITLLSAVVVAILAIALRRKKVVSKPTRVESE